MLTHEQIDAMPAGAAMDALVAEWVMGWERKPWTDPYDGLSYSHEFYSKERQRWLADNPKAYSSDIAAAWLVMEKAHGQDWLVQVDNDEGEWHCYIGGRSAIAETAPLAICRAALRAKLATK